MLSKKVKNWDFRGVQSRTLKSIGQKINFYIMCTGILAAYMSMYYIYVWWLEMPEADAVSPSTRITGYESLHRYWESNPGPLEDELVLLMAKQPLQSRYMSFYFKSLCAAKYGLRP